jgi:hypothetical protein
MVKGEKSLSTGVAALFYLILFAGGIIFNQVSTSGASFPTPYNSVEKAQDYYMNYHSSIRIYSFFMFWSALPLAIFTAFYTSQLQNSGRHHGGLSIAIFGGYAAAIFIAFSGLCTWVLSQPCIATEASAVRVLQLLAFATGGTGNVVMTGLLIGGLSITAGVGKLLPAWVIWSGVVLAIISLSAMLNMIFPGVSILLAIGRFLGMVWMIFAGFKLKKANNSSGNDS